MPREEFIQQLIEATEDDKIRWQKKRPAFLVVIDGIDIELSGKILKLYTYGSPFDRNEVAEYFIPEKRLFNAVLANIKRQDQKRRERLEYKLIHRLRSARNV